MQDIRSCMFGTGYVRIHGVLEALHLRNHHRLFTRQGYILSGKVFIYIYPRRQYSAATPPHSISKTIIYGEKKKRPPNPKNPKGK